MKGFTQRVEEKTQENQNPKLEDKGKSLLRYPSKLFHDVENTALNVSKDRDSN